MKYSDLVRRVAGDGADAWLTHYEALAARERGEQVLILSVGDPDLDTPAPVVERAVSALRAGDTHYVQAGGRPALRAAIARRHALRSGQEVTPSQVVVLAGAQNALFVASMCLAGPGDEVISFDPIYPTYRQPLKPRAPGWCGCGSGRVQNSGSIWRSLKPQSPRAHRRFSLPHRITPPA